MRVNIEQVRKKAAFIVIFIVMILIICILPLSGVSKPVHQQWQNFPNPYGYFGYESVTDHSGKDIMALEYLPYLNFSMRSGIGPIYYITLYLDLSSNGLPLNVEVIFSITGLLNTSRFTIENNTQHLVSQSSYWTNLPANFVSITNMDLDTISFNSVKPFNGSSIDAYGNWTDFGIFNHNGGSVHGSILIQLLTDKVLASNYFTGTTKNISTTSFEKTIIQQFKFKIVLKWQNQVAGLIGISGGNKTLYLGQGESFGDLNAIRLMQS